MTKLKHFMRTCSIAALIGAVQAFLISANTETIQSGNAMIFLLVAGILIGSGLLGAFLATRALAGKEGQKMKPKLTEESLLFFLTMTVCAVLISLAVCELKNAAKTPAEATERTSIPIVRVAQEIPAQTEIGGKESNYNIPLQEQYIQAMRIACEKYRVPFALALAVTECESSFNPNARNGNCYGFMQINACNYDRLRSIGIEPTTPDGNITAGVYMLGELLDRYGDTHKALMAYNCGDAGAKRLWDKGIYATKYSRNVMRCYGEWVGIFR